MCFAMWPVIVHPTTHQHKSWVTLCKKSSQSARAISVLPKFLGRSCFGSQSMTARSSLISTGLASELQDISSFHVALWNHVWVSGEGREFNPMTQVVDSAQILMTSSGTTCPANHILLTRTKSAGTEHFLQLLSIKLTQHKIQLSTAKGPPSGWKNTKLTKIGLPVRSCPQKGCYQLQ